MMAFFRCVVWPLMSGLISLGGFTSAQQYPSFPMLPWLTVPQHYSGSPLGPLVMPNPPIYAQSASADQDLAFSNYRWNMFYQQATTTVAAPVTASNTTGATGASASSGTGGSGDGTGGAGTNTATLGGSAGVGTNPANSGVNGNSGGLGQNGGSGTGNLGAQGTVAGSLGSSNGNGRGEGEDDEKETTTDAPNTDTSVATTASLNFSAVKSPDAGTRGGQACKSSQVAAGSQSGVCVSENSVSTSCTQGILAIASQCRFFQKCCIILGK